MSLIPLLRHGCIFFADIEGGSLYRYTGVYGTDNREWERGWSGHLFLDWWEPQSAPNQPAGPSTCWHDTSRLTPDGSFAAVVAAEQHEAVVLCQLYQREVRRLVHSIGTSFRHPMLLPGLPAVAVIRRIEHQDALVAYHPANGRWGEWHPPEGHCIAAMTSHPGFDALLALTEGPGGAYLHLMQIDGDTMRPIPEARWAVDAPGDTCSMGLQFQPAAADGSSREAWRIFLLVEAMPSWLQTIEETSRMAWQAVQDAADRAAQAMQQGGPRLAGAPVQGRESRQQVDSLRSRPRSSSARFPSSESIVPPGAFAPPPTGNCLMMGELPTLSAAQQPIAPGVLTRTNTELALRPVAIFQEAMHSLHLTDRGRRRVPARFRTIPAQQANPTILVGNHHGLYEITPDIRTWNTTLRARGDFHRLAR